MSDFVARWHLENNERYKLMPLTDVHEVVRKVAPLHDFDSGNLWYSETWFLSAFMYNLLQIPLIYRHYEISLSSVSGYDFDPLNYFMQKEEEDDVETRQFRHKEFYKHTGSELHEE